MTTSTQSPPDTGSPHEVLYPDLASELEFTRKMLACVPDGHEAFKPHEKNMTLGALAAHVSELPRFAKLMLDLDELDWATYKWEEAPLSNTAERLAHFDRVAKDLTDTLRAAGWPAMNHTFIMRGGDTIYMNDRRGTLVRTAGLNHIVHHRAQLGMYLRLLGVPIPGPYGQSADKM